MTYEVNKKNAYPEELFLKHCDSHFGFIVVSNLSDLFLICFEEKGDIDEILLLLLISVCHSAIGGCLKR